MRRIKRVMGGVCRIAWLVLPSDRAFHILYEGWNFNSGNYLFTTDTK